jgi:hypothetical protein
MHVTCAVHFILLRFNTLLVLSGEEPILWDHKLCYFLHHHVDSFLLRPNILQDPLLTKNNVASVISHNAPMHICVFIYICIF